MHALAEMLGRVTKLHVSLNSFWVLASVFSFQTVKAEAGKRNATFHKMGGGITCMSDIENIKGVIRYWFEEKVYTF